MTCKNDIHNNDDYKKVKFICFRGCKNRNEEIFRDWEFDGIYKWIDVDEYKATEEYRGMVNAFRKRMGWEEIV